MGILRNTKAGKSSIQISEEYLLDRGWFVKNGLLIYPPSEKGKLSNDSRYIRFYTTNEDGKQIKSFYVILKKSPIKVKIRLSSSDKFINLQSYMT